VFKNFKEWFRLERRFNFFWCHRWIRLRKIPLVHRAVIFTIWNSSCHRYRIKRSVRVLIHIGSFIKIIVFVPSRNQAFLKMPRHLPLRSFHVMISMKNRMNVSARRRTKMIAWMCEIMSRNIVSVLIKSILKSDLHSTTQRGVVRPPFLSVSSRKRRENTCDKFCRGIFLFFEL